MDSVGDQKPHAVLFPFPAQGHVNAMMRIAKLLHSRGFHITFVNTEFNHRRLIMSKGPESIKGLPDFRFETIPDGMPPSSLDASQDFEILCASVRKNCLIPFKELLAKLNSSSSDVPPVGSIISDTSFATTAGKDMGIPNIKYWAASACSFMGCLHFRELIMRGICPFKDENYLTDGTLDSPIDWIPGMRDIRLKDLPSSIRTTNPNDIVLEFIGEEAQDCLNASAIIFNTFDALEHEVLEAFTSKFNYHDIYTLGPVPFLGRHVPENQAKSLKSSLWKPDSQCLEWLNQRERQSVLYVNYGSLATITHQHFKEFAWGLANSKQPFLWIIRSDIVVGESAMLPEEFLEETKDRGFIASWCDQDEVLPHPAVGAFLTHCGWNSIMESICRGVPFICWPSFGDQQTNCRYLCTEWEIGIEINHDVKRDEVQTLVREMMEGEKGKKMRSNAQQWKKKAEEATNVGGSSYNNFEKFIKEHLHREEK